MANMSTLENLMHNAKGSQIHNARLVYSYCKQEM